MWEGVKSKSNLGYIAGVVFKRGRGGTDFMPKELLTRVGAQEGQTLNRNSLIVLLRSLSFYDRARHVSCNGFTVRALVTILISTCSIFIDQHCNSKISLKKSWKKNYHPINKKVENFRELKKSLTTRHHF